MDSMPSIGGAPPVILRSDAASGFVEAMVLPGRGMMLLQARIRRPSGETFDALEAPGLTEAAAQLDGGPEDFAGNRAFSFGGAILAPYANRIRGKPVAGSREIETRVDGRLVRLPGNWSGKAPGAEIYAMHGLILDAAVAVEQTTQDTLHGRLMAGDFEGRWPSRTELSFRWSLADGGLSLQVTATNVGDETLPMGLGWHPYFRLLSGDRSQARLRTPAALRVEVDNYDQVLPTGRRLEVAGTPYDFRAPEGRALGGLYLDDCFTGLSRAPGEAVSEIFDPAGGLRLRINSSCPKVSAVQIYAPPDKAFVVAEPQFNLADPYGSVWPAVTDTGMVRLPPGASVAYDVRVEPVFVGNRT
jgi:aldose 1-epimerase